MDAEIKKAWVEALRSGRYAQGKKVLARTHVGREFFCCLGVLCDVLQVPYTIDSDGVRHYGKCCSLLPYEVLEAADLDTSPSVPARIVKEVVGSYKDLDDDDTVALSRLNDDGISFDRIADIIERAL